jgi:hypothetical protein
MRRALLAVAILALGFLLGYEARPRIERATRADLQADCTEVPSSELPPGHPRVALPPGHPCVDGAGDATSPVLPDDDAAEQALPPGHPDVHPTVPRLQGRSGTIPSAI